MEVLPVLLVGSGVLVSEEGLAVMVMLSVTDEELGSVLVIVGSGKKK